MVVARIPIDLTWSGQSGSPGVNVWHGRFDSTDPISGDLEGLTTILQTFYNTLAGYFPSGMTVSWGGTATGVGADAEQEFTSEPWSTAGAGGGNALPPMVMFNVNWRAATGGRSGRGRTFIGPLSATTAEGNGSPAGVYLADIRTAAASLVSSSLSDMNGALGVWSRTDGLLRDFVSSSVPDKFAVLRSRRD